MKFNSLWEGLEGASEVRVPLSGMRRDFL